ncbi:MAG TPA: hypothetical protein VK324_02445 [Tepidisphaeraceae bacterium]|nr:hypothetical protein [Tepidisphaeraceae bacterium]
MAKSNGDASEDDVEAKRKQRPYPAAPIEECLELGHAIMKIGGGERIRRLTLLEKMGRSETSGAVRKMITDSGKYKITKGSFAADYLELTPMDVKSATIPLMNARDVKQHSISQ